MSTIKKAAKGLREFDAISQYFDRGHSSYNKDRTLLGVGDDCALLHCDARKSLAISVDTLVEGVHFLKGSAPASIASRALCVALSDLAAMGARPRWVTLALCVPECYANETWLSAFSRGFFEIADRYDCELIGGDMTAGPLVISVQVHGDVDAEKALKRSGARAGDAIYCTGTLGDGAAALAMLRQSLNVDVDAKDYLERRFFQPEPRIDWAQSLLGLSSCAIDLSDGLLADLRHICLASNVSAMIETEALPLSAYWRGVVSSEQAEQWALCGGDDYELCFTIPKCHEVILKQHIVDGVLDATKIGHIAPASDGPKVICTREGKPFEPEHYGYEHFCE